MSGESHIDAGASWRALSGDPAPQHAVEPVQGGWQQAWQDEHGQWHSPYAAHVPVEQPPYPHAAEALVEPQPQPQSEPQHAEPLPAPFVAPAQLEPVGPPRHYAPQRVVRDPRQRTLAAVITFVSLLIGLWAILGFMGALSQTLSSISSGNDKLKLQMAEANKGLASIDTKTRSLHDMADNSKKMGELLGGVDTDMGAMLDGVDEIAAGMEAMGASLDTLDTELGRVNDINADMSTQLGSINTGLKEQVGKVRTMRKDVEQTGTVLGTLPGRLAATNGRLDHVNRAVNVMGCRGIVNDLKVKISLGPIPNGSATVYATVVPPKAWGTQADGVTPC